MACKKEFRRFSSGEGRCPLCGFTPSFEADGYEDDAETLAYWDFEPVFEFGKWLRRRIKTLKRRIFGPSGVYLFSKPKFVGEVPPQDPLKYKVGKKSL